VRDPVPPRSYTWEELATARRVAAEEYNEAIRRYLARVLTAHPDVTAFAAIITWVNELHDAIVRCGIGARADERTMRITSLDQIVHMGCTDANVARDREIWTHVDELRKLHALGEL
jgi:hypothetical protein